MGWGNVGGQGGAMWSVGGQCGNVGPWALPQTNWYNQRVTDRPTIPLVGSRGSGAYEQSYLVVRIGTAASQPHGVNRSSGKGGGGSA